MASNYHPIFTISMILTLSTAIAAAAEESSASKEPLTSAASSFYEVLQSNGLPMGLFPKDISEFSVDTASGCFELHLHSPSPCEAKFETHVKYEWNITGTLSYGKIANLSGVSAQELFLWLPVKSIQVDIPSSGLIYFDVGMVFKQFSLSFFETPKDCNALEVNGGRDDELARFVRGGGAQDLENHTEKFVREEIKDDKGRAVS